MFLTLLITGCGSEKTPDEIVSDDILRIGTDPNYPPFEVTDPQTGRLEGFDIDLITEICQTTGLKAQFVMKPFDCLISGLIDRQYDVAISALTITSRRVAMIDFSKPYYVSGQIIAVPQDDSLIITIYDLTGKRVGVQSGSTGEIMARGIDGLHVFSYDSIGEAFVDMTTGHLDAILNDWPTTQAYIKQHDAARTVGEILTAEQYCIAFSKGDSELL